ncbi:MAG: FAD-dependent oxidoreductase [Promethearchaeota archaeon]
MMEIEESARKIPVLANVDVLVVGGGPSGISAAIAAAREGMKTMLMERFGFFGGNITQSMVGTIGWYRFAKTVEAGGICLEFERKAEKMGAIVNDFNKNLMNTKMGGYFRKKGLIKEGKFTHGILNTDLFKIVADEMIKQAGVIPLLHCMAVDVLKDGNIIKGVIVESKSGRQAILAKRVIDATGDADIAFKAGAPYRKDPREKLLGATLNFSCSGVDIEEFFSYFIEKVQQNPSLLSCLKTSGELFFMDEISCLLEPLEDLKKDIMISPDIKVKSFWKSYSEGGEIYSFNGIHMGNIDCTNINDLTKAEMEGRKRVIKALKKLKKRTPGFKNVRLKNFGFSLGTRESRKIIGEYELTEWDITNQARFKDSIGICPEFVDGYGRLILPLTGRYFQVTYRITVPLKIENLLVVGRAVAGDKISHATTRQMVCCTITGQGAGVASAISIKEKVPCRNVNISHVQEALMEKGVRIS